MNFQFLHMASADLSEGGWKFLRFIYVHTSPCSGSIIDEYEIKLYARSEG